MPELPEVETVVRDLRNKLVGKKVLAVWTDWPKLIKDPLKQSRLQVSWVTVRKFKKEIVGCTVERVERRAKNILIYLSGDLMMLVHQKMTGHFLVGRWLIKKDKIIPIYPDAMVNDSYNGYIHLLLTLSNGQMLALSDVRKFAKVLFGPRDVIKSLPELTRLGSDALDKKLTTGQFVGIVQCETRPIKQVLMDPFVVAGIGNIYSDEILWQAKVHPTMKANNLTKTQLQIIHKAMRQILTKAVKLRGTSTSDFRDTDGRKGGYTRHRLVYGRKGEPCSRCKSPIERMVIGGRGTHFCGKCQKTD